MAPTIRSSPAVNRAFKMQMVDWFLHCTDDELNPLTDAIAPIPPK